jgi:hypothetical protein
VGDVDAAVVIEGDVVVMSRRSYQALLDGTRTARLIRDCEDGDGLLARCEAGPRLAKLVAGVDRRVLLLEDGSHEAAA